MLLLKPPSSWYFVAAALTNQYRYQPNESLHLKQGSFGKWYEAGSRERRTMSPRTQIPAMRVLMLGDMHAESGALSFPGAETGRAGSLGQD